MSPARRETGYETKVHTAILLFLHNRVYPYLGRIDSGRASRAGLVGGFQPPRQGLPRRIGKPQQRPAPAHLTNVPPGAPSITIKSTGPPGLSSSKTPIVSLPVPPGQRIQVGAAFVQQRAVGAIVHGHGRREAFRSHRKIPSDSASIASVVSLCRSRGISGSTPA